MDLLRKRAFRIAIFLLIITILINGIFLAFLNLRVIDTKYITWFFLYIPLALISEIMLRRGSSSLRFIWKKIGLLCGGLGFLAIMIATALILQDATVSLCAAVIDNTLARTDVTIGFDWRSIYFLIRRHEWLFYLLGIAYNSYGYQVLAILVVLIFANDVGSVAEYLMFFAASTFIAITVSAFFPATNPYYYFGVLSPGDPTPWSQFFQLRNGTLTSIDLANGQGLVSFPSLHAAHGMIFSYVLRNIRIANVVVLLLNVTMIVSAIPMGGHYIVDILAGLALGVALIVWWQGGVGLNVFKTGWKFTRTVERNDLGKG